MAQLNLTYPTVTDGVTVVDAVIHNTNWAECVTAVNGVDHTQIGAAGLYASNLLPTTAAQATFGATATGVGYKFLANDATATPLTISGVTSQTADIFDVTLTSGGTKAVFVDSKGNLTFGNIGGGSGAAGSAYITGGGSGALLFNAATGQPSAFAAGNGSNLLSIASTGNVAVSGGFSAGGGYLSTSGVISTAVSSTTGQIVFGGTGGSSLTGTGTFYFDGAKYNFYSAGSGGSTANIVASTGVYTATSDAILKENVADLSLGLSDLMKLRPVSFDWINSKEHSQGFLAQDVQAVIPHAVRVVDDKSGTLGLSDALLTPVIVKSIQELAAAFHAYITAHP